MYIPSYHAWADVGAMQTHMAQHALGAWVCSTADGLVANHIPFWLDRGHGRYGRLLGHVSRANPVWRQLSAGSPSVVMFMGPQAYVTPSWYPGKQAHGKVVPTWNYVTVHAHGVMRAREDSAWMLNMLTRLTDVQEASRPRPWRLQDAPHDYLQGMMRAIVGIELDIDRLEGRLKASQDEAADDRLGTVQGLTRQTDTQAQSLALLVQQQLHDL